MVEPVVEPVLPPSHDWGQEWNPTISVFRMLQTMKFPDGAQVEASRASWSVLADMMTYLTERLMESMVKIHAAHRPERELQAGGVGCFADLVCFTEVDLSKQVPGTPSLAEVCRENLDHCYSALGGAEVPAKKQRT